MKTKLLPLIALLLCFIPQFLTAQTYEWALTKGTMPRSNAVAIREDANKDVYFAYYTDSVTVRVSSHWEKRTAASQQIIWQKDYVGDITITDVELNTANHPVVLGYFSGTVNLDGTLITSPGPASMGFIFETDLSGTIIWSNTFSPLPGTNFSTGDLFIGADGNFYITSGFATTEGFCAFHKLNPQGAIITNEFNYDFEVRTFSHILTDGDNNIYLSGTCGNLAAFDTIAANPNFSYQNFLVKYDSTFKAQWLQTRNYITFDDNNSLGTDGQDLYWAFNLFSGNADTVQIIKAAKNGTILNTINAPVGVSFFPGLDYGVDMAGNSTLVLNTFTRYYVYRYDAAFNIIWADTLFGQASGFPLQFDVQCYDSCFYMTGVYLNDTLQLGNFTLLNPNVGQNYQSDLFLTKWSYASPLAVSNNEIAGDEIIIYPNPSSGYFNIKGLNKHVNKIELTDAIGKVVLKKETHAFDFTTIDTGNLRNGIYFVKVYSGKKNTVLKLHISN
jgi:Secretion system C-terminal sorting domain